jgi:hypothetical protein
LSLGPDTGLALPLCHLGGWGVTSAVLYSLGALVQHLLIPYPLAKCKHYRSIGDTRNGIANLREPLDEGAQGFNRTLLDGVEIGLVTRPSISALEVGRELAGGAGTRSGGSPRGDS